ncbi:hypothetical protein M4I32_15060 [Microbacterium sp. LRZ72]|uniref:hypothetical protein n=1 Tax=Microbacterium sp. LRZ72 TaxID=2942481 RepID=UPI0029B1E71C|nr:hypothetical protein [Microbacterium sp. LRZ72]MDX2378109.1 hypothetical protein [Microbacterium sp. LRZ72]
MTRFDELPIAAHHAEKPKGGVHTRFASRMLAGAAIAVGALALSGCVESAHISFADLDREATARDVPPDRLPDDALGGMDLDTFRLAAEYEGAQVYLARGNENALGEVGNGDEQSVCVVIVGPADDYWSASCSLASAPQRIRGPGPPMWIVTPDGVDRPDNAEPLSENVAVVTDTGLG